MILSPEIGFKTGTTGLAFLKLCSLFADTYAIRPQPSFSLPHQELQSGNEVGSIKIVGEKLSAAGALYLVLVRIRRGRSPAKLITDY